ncbi:MAG: hypothetical protein WAK82_17370 [Streptosporangiaceae bacterium]
MRAGHITNILIELDGDQARAISDWTRDHLDGPEWEHTSERSVYVGSRRGQADMPYEFFG